jgi:hypothetical protein
LLYRTSADLDRLDEAKENVAAANKLGGEKWNKECQTYLQAIEDKRRTGARKNTTQPPKPSSRQLRKNKKKR